MFVRSKRRFVWLSVVFLAELLEICSSISTVSPELLEKCRKNPEKRLTLMLELEPVAPSHFKDVLTTEDDKNNLIRHLKLTTSASQRPVISAMKTIRAISTDGIHSYWIDNKISVKNFSCSSLSEISKIPGVLKVREEFKMFIQGVIESEIQTGTVPTPNTLEYNTAWGVKKIEAPWIWDKFGKNCIKTIKVPIVASIDTGVRGTHVALKNNWLNNGNAWYDAYTQNGSGIPFDDNGHGTHTMGTMCGTTKDIGVAPGVKWIACKGCDKLAQCSESALIGCGQWIACPSSNSPPEFPGPEKCGPRPVVVNNSWGGGQGESFYNAVVAVWNQLSIIPVFAIGNSGWSGQGVVCASANSPGDQNEVIGVGATAINDTRAYFSSIGPSISSGRFKPDISAPGLQILSSYFVNDTSYASGSGTSMATPHVAGAIALIACHGGLDRNFHVMLAALGTTGFQPYYDGVCSTTDNKPLFPNNFFGYSRINVRTANEFLNPKPPHK